MAEEVAQTYVMDASAVLALLQGEPGGERVARTLPGSIISTVNLAEAHGKVARSQRDPRQVGSLLVSGGLEVEPFSEADAEAAGAMEPSTRKLGLSLGGRACLALAERLGRPILTADRALAEAARPVSVELIR